MIGGMTVIIFRERLKALREQHGFDQKDMGKKLNISPSAYGFYEQGRNEPSLESLKRLSEILNVSTDYLLGLSNVEKQPIVYSLSDKTELSEKELNVINKMKETSLLEKISENPIENVERLNRYWDFIQKEHEL